MRHTIIAAVATLAAAVDSVTLPVSAYEPFPQPSELTALPSTSIHMAVTSPASSSLVESISSHISNVTSPEPSITSTSLIYSTDGPGFIKPPLTSKSVTAIVYDTSKPTAWAKSTTSSQTPLGTTTPLLFQGAARKFGSQWFIMIPCSLSILAVT